MSFFRKDIATTSAILHGLIVSSVLLPSAIVSIFAGSGWSTTCSDHRLLRLRPRCRHRSSLHPHCHVHRRTHHHRNWYRSVSQHRRHLHLRAGSSRQARGFDYHGTALCRDKRSSLAISSATVQFISAPRCLGDFPWRFNRFWRFCLRQFVSPFRSHPDG